MAKTDVKVDLSGYENKSFRMLCDDYGDIRIRNSAYTSGVKMNIYEQYGDFSFCNPDEIRVIGYIDDDSKIVYVLGDGLIYGRYLGNFIHNSYGYNTKSNYTRTLVKTLPNYQGPNEQAMYTSVADENWQSENIAGWANVADTSYSVDRTKAYPTSSSSTSKYTTYDSTGALSDTFSVSQGKFTLKNDTTTPLKVPYYNIHIIKSSDTTKEVPESGGTYDILCTRLKNSELATNGDLAFAAAETARNLAETVQLAEGAGVLSGFSYSSSGTHPTGDDAQVGASLFGLILTHKLDEAQAYINGGSLPSDAFVNGVKTPDSGDDPGEDGSFDDDLDDIDVTEPTNTSLTLSNQHVYYMDSIMMEAFYKDLWDTDWTDIFGRITGVYTDVISNVVNIKFMPIPSDAVQVGASTGIILGFKTMTTTAPTLTKTLIKEIGTYTFVKPYKSFLSYAPYTDVKLYLPMYGMLDLDVNLFMGSASDGGSTRKCVVKAVYDVAGGTITYFILADETIVYSVQANFGTCVPVSLQDGADFVFNMGSKVTELATGAAMAVATAGTSTAIGTASTIGSAIGGAVGNGAQVAPMKVTQSGQGDGALYGNEYCTMFIRYPLYHRPGIYDNRVGYPSWNAAAVSSFEGFVQFYNPVINFSDRYPSSTSIDEIYSLLSNGVYV